MAGSLVVVGTGIALSHLTCEADGAIRSADAVFYLVGDPVTTDWIRRVNPRTQSLFPLYREGGDRRATYREMVDLVLDAVRAGLAVCLALYGHPGVFANPGHGAIEQARLEGYPAEMLPAVSALDCLFADLALDPATRGCQMYEATDFLLHPPQIEPATPLVLWQAGLLRILVYQRHPEAELLPLQTRVADLYGTDHPVVLYEAAPYPGIRPSIRTVAVRDLVHAVIGPSCTLYIPAAGRRRTSGPIPPNPDATP